MKEDEERQGEQPWKLIEKGIEEADVGTLADTFDALSRSDTARALSRLSQRDQTQLLKLLPPEDAAGVIADVPEAQAADMIEHLSSEDAAAIVGEMPSDHAVDVLGELDEETSAAIVEELPPSERADVRELLSYDENTAGGIMVKEYLAFNESLLVADVLQDFEQNAEQYIDFDVQYTYVVDGAGRLIGVLRLRDLVLAPRRSSIAGLMIPEPLSVFVEDTLTMLRDFFEDHPYIGVPVVDADGVLLGVVLRDAVRRAENRVADETFLASTGIVGGEELRSMGFFRRSSRRLSWLSINILLNVVAASVIAVYQETLAAVIVLAVFLPIISDMSGCSGNQAVAVSIRELTLGVIRPRDVLRILWKEGVIGLINGLVLGLLLGMVAWVWQGNVYLGLVVGAALMANTLIAVVLGGAVPLILRGMNQDPALASGPILTTVTDMCGFFLVLSLAAAWLAKLTV